MTLSAQIAENLNKEEFDDSFFEWEERTDAVPYLNHCIAGSIAGVIEHTILFPFDSIKTHMQTLHKKETFSKVAADMYKKEGFSRFWRGVTAIAIGCIPAHACYFSVYELSKRFVSTHIKSERYQQLSYALTGAMAPLIHDLILTPMDTMKQRMQIAPKNLKNYRKLVKLTYKNEGIQAFYRSYPVTLFMNVPHAAILIGINETLKHSYKPEGGHSILSYLLCASIAGSSAAISTIPLDNIKTRLQTQSFIKYFQSIDGSADFRCLFNEKSLKVDGSKEELLRPGLQRKIGSKITSVHSRAFSSVPPEQCGRCVSIEADRIVPFKFRDISKVIKNIYIEEGARGFFKGVCPRVISMAPASAISWTTYEVMKNFLNKKMPAN